MRPAIFSKIAMARAFGGSWLVFIFASDIASLVLRAASRAHG